MAREKKVGGAHVVERDCDQSDALAGRDDTCQVCEKGGDGVRRKDHIEGGIRAKT